MTFIAVRQQLR